MCACVCVSMHALNDKVLAIMDTIIQVFYIELMCDDDELITENIKVRTNACKTIPTIACVCH